jgi:ketosteroid isomerase-like protein
VARSANEDVVVGLSEAITRRDPDAAVALCDQELEFLSMLDVSGRRYLGHEGIRQYFRDVESAWDEWRVEVHRTVQALDERVAIVMTMHVRGRESRAPLSERTGHVWTLRDGLLLRNEPYRDPDDALRAVGASPAAEPPAMRASDAEREIAAARLRIAARDGRLDLDELAERLDVAFAAVTRAELEKLTADLPAESSPSEPATKARRWFIGIMGGGTQRGRWRIAEHCTVLNVMGGADLDLTDAVVSDTETEILVLSLMGGSKIIVPDGVHVELSGFAFMGGNDLRMEDAPPPPPGAPVVRVRAYSVMGGTDVKRRSRKSRALPA